MFCVIQKITNKKPNLNGAYKEIISDTLSITYNGKTTTKYKYYYSGERFERPNKTAYKIMIHKSYRENGKVKKKQWVICTVGYYDLIDYGVCNCVNYSVLEEKLTKMRIDEGTLWDMIYEKLDPIIEQIEAEFSMTAEYQTKQKHKQFIADYQKRKKEFEDKYGADTYEYCYDFYGELKNPEYLESLKEALKQREQYQESSYRSQSSSNYSYEDFGSFFNSSYSIPKHSNYTEEEKALLKKMVRTLTKTYHPDITKDDGEMMKLINKLKDQWGI